MAKITFEDKVSLNPQPSVANKNKVSDADMNEIKSSVNDLYDNLAITTGSGTMNNTIVRSTEVNTYTRSGNVVNFTFTFITEGGWSNTTTIVSNLPKPKTSTRFIGLNTANNAVLRFLLSAETGNLMNWYSYTNPGSGNNIEITGTYITKD